MKCLFISCVNCVCMLVVVVVCVLIFCNFLGRVWYLVSIWLYRCVILLISKFRCVLFLLWWWLNLFVLCGSGFCRKVCFRLVLRICLCNFFCEFSVMNCMFICCRFGMFFFRYFSCFFICKVKSWCKLV